jgi:PAS domain-containing protein
VSLVACGIRDASGKVIGLSTIMRDITDRKRAERETALLATVVNSSDDAIISVTPDSKIITWNPAAERIYGYTAEEAIGKGVDLFVPREELDKALPLPATSQRPDKRSHGSKKPTAEMAPRLFPRSISFPSVTLKEMSSA